MKSHGGVHLRRVSHHQPCIVLLHVRLIMHLCGGTGFCLNFSTILSHHTSACLSVSDCTGLARRPRGAGTADEEGGGGAKPAIRRECQGAAGLGAAVSRGREGGGCEGLWVCDGRRGSGTVLAPGIRLESMFVTLKVKPATGWTQSPKARAAAGPGALPRHATATVRILRASS
jgi:hypothetical protein